MDQDEAALRLGFFRVAAATPKVVLGDLGRTADNIILQARQLCEKDGAKLIVFPELCLAGGYTNADLFFQDAIINGSLEALGRLCAATKDLDAVLVAGLPLAIDGSLYNVAAVVERGRILGIVPKTYLPTYKEFYEARWFASAKKLRQKKIRLFGDWVPVGTDILFRSEYDPRLVLAIEICEDAWVPIPPSCHASLAGATVVCNLSASNEIVGKADYRRKLVSNLSAVYNGVYIYACAGAGESTTDLVFPGHDMIAVNGTVIAESDCDALRQKAVIADINIGMCAAERMRNNSFADCAMYENGRHEYRVVEIGLFPAVPQVLRGPNPAHPFVPLSVEEQKQVCFGVLHNQAAGLAQRLKAIGKDGEPAGMVLGLSGGLDSTAALMACIEACKLLGVGPGLIHAYTMPSECTTSRTLSNAIELARAAGVSIEEIPIGALVSQLLFDIGHDGKSQDVVYENAQARVRTMILFQKANMLGAIVVGTGDESEAANGFTTRLGDWESNYNVNAGIPKTLVRFMMSWFADNYAATGLAKVLRKIVGTPISPELTKPKDGAIAQITEDIVGPYELLDFYMYHLVRYGSGPEKMLYLASQAFKGKYSIDELAMWLQKFIKRFFANQFKRSVAPDGPKVGSVALSPRGDWRMPSDILPVEWLKGLKEFAAWLKEFYANS